MTSCLLVKSSKRLVAVADGRLSRDDNSQSFNETRKLREFEVSYQIPVFDRGRFHSFRRYRSEPWYLAYAGTHTVTTEIIDLFLQRIGSLYLTRHEQGQHAMLSHSTLTSGVFTDDYNFDQEELLKIHGRDVLQELVDAFEIRGSENSENRRSRPDSEFILFGNEEASGDYKAFVVSADENGYSPGARLRIKADPVLDGQLASIGSEIVRTEVYADEALMRGLEGWKQDEDYYAGLDSVLAKRTGGSLLPSPPTTAWSINQVGKRFLQLLCTTADPSVGGRMILADGDWSKEIQLRAFDPPRK
jgi:hypothetical protein